jgi:hypothetical protein
MTEGLRLTAVAIDETVWLSVVWCDVVRFGTTVQA